MTAFALLLWIVAVTVLAALAGVAIIVTRPIEPLLARLGVESRLVTRCGWCADLTDHPAGICDACVRKHFTSEVH